MSARRHILRVIVAGLFLCGVLPAWGQGGANGGGLEELRERALRDGTTRVIVQVGSRQVFRAEGRLPRAQAAVQRNRMREARERVLNRAGAGRVVRRFESVPFVAMEVDAATLDRLSADNEVSGIVADPLLEPSLSDSVPLIEADVAHGMGLNGSGSTIAILDTGIDGTHPFLLGKVVEEACYAAGDNPNMGTCPNGSTTQLGAGSAVPCAYESGCAHGTHVAGIAAGSGASFTGVAPGANLIAIQVFHVSQFCYPAPCVLAWGSDVLAGLERVYELRDEYTIAAVNMSLGGGLYDACDDVEPAMTLAIDNLRAVGIATVVAAGNDGAADAMGFPACISSAVSVGATDDHDQVATFSNASPLLELFAPGVAINSSVTGGSFQSYSGTSMATPHVAGAWAIMRQGSPNATVDEVLATLVSTGRPVLDHRGSTPVTKPRIRLSGALGVNAPAPVIGQVSPTALLKWSPTSALTIAGSGFVRGTYALVNGQQRPTTYVDASTLTVSVLASDLATSASSLAIAVATPPPGGGTSSSVNIALLPAEVTFSTTVAEPRDTVTVSWSGAPSGSNAWVALARVGAADTAFTSFAYMSTLAGNSWNVVMPATTGDYEVRFYSDGTYTSRAFTAGPITVREPPPQGQASLSVSATEATAGQSVTATLTNGSGGAADWIALARVGTPTSSYVRWTYVGAGNTTFNWTVPMPSTAGNYEFRLFANGGATLVATSPTVAVTAPPPTGPPVLTVGATSVTSGAPLTVTLTGGLGGGADWITLARVGTPTTSYVQWTYVGAGNTTFNWTVSAPSTPAQYEFRLFANGGYSLLATSPTVTVNAAQPPPGGATLTVNTQLAAPGTPITVTLTGGSGGATDWLAFAKVGTSSSSYLSYTYVGSGVTTRTWTVTAPTTAGDYVFRLLPNNGYTVTATSPPVTVQVTEPPAPTLEVDRTTASPGESVTLTVTSSVPFGSTDWVALARVGAPETAFLQYRYVGGGQTTFVWTVAMPSTFGGYEFRLYRNNNYTRVATSPTVSVQ